MTRYEQKEIWLNSPQDWWYFSCDFTTAAVFYRDIFPVNSFESKMGKLEEYPKTNKGNGFVIYQDGDKFKSRMIFDDLDFSNLFDFDTVFMSPISYFGRNRTSANARELFALTFDLDEVGSAELSNLFGFWIYQKRVPRPTYVVNSGSGVHLYYVFDNPIPLYPNIQQELKKMKYELTNRIWNGDTSQLKIKQFQGINQGFRLVGGRTKDGEKVTAYRTGEKITLLYLNQFVSAENQIHDTFYHSKLSLEEAKIKYPEWYEQRIVLGRKKSNWTCNRALYDWWKRQKGQAEVHHRYFYIMCLTVYAIKCGIEFDELKKDAYGMVDYLNNIEPSNPFTEADVKSALEMYQECYRSFPRDEIAKISGIEIKPNKRNGRTRAENLKIARFIQDMDDPKREWQGRRSVENAVFRYMELNSGAKAKNFCEETGLSRAVFYKYKKLWAEKKAREFERYKRQYAFASLFDNCVKDAETGEPVDLIELITGIPVPPDPNKEPD